MQVQAIVFDFDGTVVDTETPWFLAASELFARHGRTLDLSDWARGIGTSSEVFDLWGHLGRVTGQRVNRQALEPQYRGRVAELVAAEPLRPGVAALLSEARDRGVRIGLASSSERGWVCTHLARHGLQPAFDALCTREDVARVKPDPALYRLAVKRLGVPAGATLAVEDSPNGALAAQRAGLPCVIVPNLTTNTLDFPPGSPRLASLDGITLDTLTRLFPGQVEP